MQFRRRAVARVFPLLCVALGGCLPAAEPTGLEYSSPIRGLGLLGGSVPGARLVALGEAKRYVGTLVWPLRSSPGLTSRFGIRSVRFHDGLDLPAAEGTAVYAAHDGTVIMSGASMRSYGRIVVVRGQGLLTIYAHNSRNLVTAGEEVSAGERIAEVGSSGNASGPHLHFETRVATVKGYVAVDPLVFFVN